MPESGNDADRTMEKVLGYLNFSSGARDLQFLAGIDELYARAIGDAAACDDCQTDAADSDKPPGKPPWQLLRDCLAAGLEDLGSSSPAFRDAEQAQAVLDLTFTKLLPAYRRFHSDLLFHQTDAFLFNSLFVAVALEATLKQGAPWDEEKRVVDGALEHLNDYVGFRPVATLDNRRLEPYPHERFRPIPLYFKEAGVATGPHRSIIERAIELLRDTDQALLQAAQFDPELMDELAMDPRAYDFDHPVNKRPNHHFGQWDPQAIDGRGNFRRFVIQQVTFDALTSRVEQATDLDADELREEAAAVLAGTILMASGVSGHGPGAHDSSVTLANLLPIIATYRDEFYQQLFDRMDGNHAARLRAEAAEKRQPFGGARQHLNAELAKVRASQLEHVHLAMIFGRMGYSDAAMRQANVVPVASARMICQIDCAIDAAMQSVQNGDLADAADKMPAVKDTLLRGIACGAIIDPWNILGFDGNFSLFPAMENSVRDHRADDLVGLIEHVLAVYSRLWSEAAAVDDKPLVDRIRRDFSSLAEWWRQFAAHEVQSVAAVDSLIVFHAAEHVAQALAVWHQGGAETGDVAFWATHTEIFDSPKAYALVVDALMQRGDDVASMAILIHWLSQGNEIGLEEGDSSFHLLAESWMARHYQQVVAGDKSHEELCAIQKRIEKQFDFLEANADDYWLVPQFDLRGNSVDDESSDAGEEDSDGPDDDSGEDLFSAAYENVVYQDSTDDGQEGEVFEQGGFINDELEEVSLEISERLEFIATMSTMLKLAAGIAAFRPQSQSENSAAEPTQTFAEFALVRCEALTRWIEIATVNRKELSRLMEDVRRYPILFPGGDHDSMVEYDRQRLAKESLLDRIILACVGYDDAIRWLLAAKQANRSFIETHNSNQPDASQQLAVPPPVQLSELSSENRILVTVFAAALIRDRDQVRALVPGLLEAMNRTPLLYVPMAKGGNPHEIVEARGKQQALQELLVCVPRLGLLTETRELLEAARDMERNNPVGHGAVTEFDELFKIGYTGIVESIVVSSKAWPDETRSEMIANSHVASGSSALFDVVERATETLLVTWLAHSRTLRLSVLEKVSEKRAWGSLVEFIKRYGEDLFSQRFFNLGNLRAILHQGVDAWLAQLEQDPADYDLRLLDELGGRLNRDEAIQMLTLVLEAIIENYAEYRDYNSTTTQSDQGELLYMLLDFLRLRTQYDRVAWHLKPVVWSHATLVRHGEKQASRLWRRALTERLGDEPNKYLAKLTALQSKYAMRMPTVADRLSERFIQPLQIDRIKALVEPAMKDPETAASRRTFELLEHEVEVLTREPSGVGLDIPLWLASLEEEVEQVRQRLNDQEIEAWGLIHPVSLTLDDVKTQLDQMKTDVDDEPS